MNEYAPAASATTGSGADDAMKNRSKMTPSSAAGFVVLNIAAARIDAVPGGSEPTSGVPSVQVLRIAADR